MLDCSTSRHTRACGPSHTALRDPCTGQTGQGGTHQLSACAVLYCRAQRRHKSKYVTDPNCSLGILIPLRTTALGCRQLSCFQLSLSGFRHTLGTTQVTMSGALKAHNAHKVCQNHLCLPLSCSLLKAVHGLPLGSCASGTLPLLLTKCYVINGNINTNYCLLRGLTSRLLPPLQIAIEVSSELKSSLA